MWVTYDILWCIRYLCSVNIYMLSQRSLLFLEIPAHICPLLKIYSLRNWSPLQEHADLCFFFFFFLILNISITVYQASAYISYDLFLPITKNVLITTTICLYAIKCHKQGNPINRDEKTHFKQAETMKCDETHLDKTVQCLKNVIYGLNVTQPQHWPWLKA